MKHTMKKTVALSVACALTMTLCLLLALFAGAEAAHEAVSETSNVAYVTIADETGALVCARQPVTLRDTDGDGALTVSDALYLAHEAKHPQGAAAYGAEATAYGISLIKLWGTENGGAYGYYLNNASAASLAAPVAAGDTVAAFIYTDLLTYGDTYCYFDVSDVTVGESGSLTLTLTKAGFDAGWNPVTLPVSGATVTANGAVLGTTDESGRITFTLTAAGDYLVSATSETETLVPPVCFARFSSSVPENTIPTERGGEDTEKAPVAAIVIGAAGVVLLAGAAAGLCVGIRKKRNG